MNPGNSNVTLLTVTIRDSQFCNYAKRTRGNDDLGVWAAHGEGRFHSSRGKKLQIIKYLGPISYADSYPANPNGSDYNAAMLSSAKMGDIWLMMPHLERSTFPWNWGHYA